jgi:ABC-2 type transport system ATP-binding protein
MLATKENEKHARSWQGAALAIETRGLARSYGDHTAVVGLDLGIRVGEIYGFLGPNGAGKSTVVRMLCTLLRPTGGTALVAGHDVEHEALEVRRRIGVALQDAALDEGQTGRELLTLQGRLYGLSSGQTRRRLDEVLDLVDIGAAIDDRVKTYSGGMKRRLDLAASLVHGPEVLFLDEPTTGLDPHSRYTVWSEVRRLNGELSMTIFLTTQYLEEADELADRVGILSAGRLVAQGSPAELKRSVGGDVVVAEVDGHDESVSARLAVLDLVEGVRSTEGRLAITTSDGPAAIVPIAAVLGRTDLGVRSLTLTTPTLDDVFMALTGFSLDADKTPVVELGEAR